MTSAQDVRLRFAVSEADFNQLLDEMNLEGDVRDSARGLWGQQWFNQQVGQRAYQDLKEWAQMEMPLASDFIQAGPEYYNPDKAPWNWSHIGKTYAYGQREIFEELLANLTLLLPHEVEAIEAAGGRWRNRTILGLRWREKQIIGSSTNIIDVIWQLDHESPELLFGTRELPKNIETILQDYEAALSILLINLDRISLADLWTLELYDVPEEEENIPAWIDWFIQYEASGLIAASKIRTLNYQTGLAIAPLLGPIEKELFLNRARRLISPFAYKTLNWEYWTQAILEENNLDLDLRTAIESLQHQYLREQNRYASKLDKMYNARMTPISITNEKKHLAEWRADIQDEDDYFTKDHLAYNAAIISFADFDRKATSRIKAMIGEWVDVISGSVVQRIKAQTQSLRSKRFSTERQATLKSRQNKNQPRYNQPFITGLEFQQCVEQIAFEGAERTLIFAVLYEDFREHFTITHADFERRRLIAYEKNIADNPRFPPSGRQRVSVNTVMAWNQRWIMLRKNLEAEFDEQVRLFLNDADLDIWNHEVRRLRRFRLIPNMRYLVGYAKKRHTYDLIDIVERLELSPINGEQFQQVLLSCELAIDSTCHTFEDQYTPLNTEFYAVLADYYAYQTDALEARRDKLQDELTLIPEGIVNIRKHFVPLIAEALEEPSRSQFLAAIDRVEYPWIFKLSPPELVIAALNRDKFLDVEQVEQLNLIESEYVNNLESFRTGYLRLVKQLGEEDDPEKRTKLFGPIYGFIEKRSQIAQDSCVEIRNLFDDNEFHNLAFDIRWLLSSTR